MSIGLLVTKYWHGQKTQKESKMKVHFPINGFEFETEEEDVEITTGGLTIGLAENDGELQVTGNDSAGNVMFVQRFQVEAD